MRKEFIPIDREPIDVANRAKVKACELFHRCQYHLIVATLPCLAVLVSHSMLSNSLRDQHMLGIDSKRPLGEKRVNLQMQIALCCLDLGPGNRLQIILFTSTDIDNGYIYA